MKPLLLTLNFLVGADAATTHYAVTHGAREVVIPTQNPWAIDGIVAGVAFSESELLLWINRRHGKTAKILGWSFVGVRAVAVVNNVRQLRLR